MSVTLSERKQEEAFRRKYPNRPSSEWQEKTQKYRPVGAAATIQVPLREMVGALAVEFACECRIEQREGASETVRDRHQLTRHAWTRFLQVLSLRDIYYMQQGPDASL